MTAAVQRKVPIQSTSGAITVRNERGELMTEKVKVNRYVTGKRPEYAPESSSEEDSDVEINLERRRAPERRTLVEEDESSSQVVDRRLLRLQQHREQDDLEDDDDNDARDRLTRHRRQVIEPELVEDETSKTVEARYADEETSEEEDIDEEEIEKRRALLRKRALERQEEEILNVQAEKSDVESDFESSETESEYESEKEAEPRLKPVFIRKKDRVTIQEKIKREQQQQDVEAKAKQLAEERRKQTVKIVENIVRAEREEVKESQEDATDHVNSADENDEEAYAAWKVRELRRLKRDREERDQEEKEKQEIERVRNLTEDQRRQELKQNPRVITNRASKGKYKFLQKYYHRGAFYLDQEDGVYKRDFTAPTLEDHFNRTVLPKVMQVKNFGRSGRTKYTHLLDQDTTNYESPWQAETTQNIKFHMTKGGGMKQTFDRPSARKQK